LPTQRDRLEPDGHQSLRFRYRRSTERQQDLGAGESIRRYRLKRSPKCGRRRLPTARTTSAQRTSPTLPRCWARTDSTPMRMRYQVHGRQISARGAGANGRPAEVEWMRG
jgi:hypothetical protein